MSEHHEQVEVVRYLRAAGVCFCAIPNGARTSMGTARKLKAEGLEAGAPDLLIFDPPPGPPPNLSTHEFCPGVAIEMKASNGSKPSAVQLDWQIKLAARGWVTLVCYGAAEALTELAKIGYRVPWSR